MRGSAMAAVRSLSRGLRGSHGACTFVRPPPPRAQLRELRVLCARMHSTEGGGGHAENSEGEESPELQLYGAFMRSDACAVWANMHIRPWF